MLVRGIYLSAFVYYFGQRAMNSNKAAMVSDGGNSGLICGPFTDAGWLEGEMDGPLV